MMTMRVYLLFGIFFVVATDGHICLLHPDQRGGANVSTPGNPTCYNPGPACGDVSRFPVGTPHVLMGGSGFDVKLQQALNHYQAGNEGWIDVAFSTESSPVSDDNFTVIARIPDVYKHMQAQQTNYTIPITVPDLDLEHGVLRVSYHSNKPTEPLAFRNCADISIVKSGGSAPSPPPALLALVEATQPRLEDATQQQGLMRVHDDGSLVEVSTVPEPWRLQGAVVAEVPSQPPRPAELVFLGAAHDRNPDDAVPPGTLLRFADDGQSSGGGWSQTAVDFGDLLAVGETGTVSALVRGDAGSSEELYAVVQVRGTDSQGADTFAFALVAIDPASGKASAPVAGASAPRTATESTFVNFLWATRSGGDGSVYVLAGDENSLFALNAVVHTFHASGKVTTVPLDNSAYVMQHLHADPASGALFALSPGLFTAADQSSAWHLVQVDAETGNVTLVGDLGGTSAGAEPAQHLDADFGGSVVGSINGGTMTHVLRRSESKAHIVVHVNLECPTRKCAFAASVVDTGVNSENRAFTFIQTLGDAPQQNGLA